MAQFWTIGRLLECVIQTELVVKLISPNRKEAISSISAEFHHMPERYERVRVGWHCAKVKGHAELKIEKTEKRPLVTISPNYIIPTPTVSVLTSTYANLKKKRFKS